MLKKITIEMGGTEVSLTVEQAKKLRDELNSLFEHKIEYVPPNPWPWTYRPWYPTYYGTIGYASSGSCLSGANGSSNTSAINLKPETYRITI